MQHHTKTKGDIGVAKVIADLTCNGIDVCIPLSEHLPFDLIGIDEKGILSRIQVKYISGRDGKIALFFRNHYSDKNGYHTKKHDKTMFDSYAIYCPNTDTIYYLRTDELVGKESIALRITPSKNNQTKNVKIANEYANANRMF